MRGIFVTGTDTGVGKTFFCCQLIRFLKEKGIDAFGFKPVETGCCPECEDAKRLAKVSGKYLEPIYSFREPLAPAMAADLENVDVNIDKIVSRCKEVLSEYPVVIEGAGGIMVPISWKFSFLDLVRELSVPVLVVALNKLGVINHTLLTVNICQGMGIRVLGVVLNNYQQFDESFTKNLESLKRLVEVPVVPFSSFRDMPNVAEQLKLLEIFLH